MSPGREMESQVSDQPFDKQKTLSRFLNQKTCFLLLNCLVLAIGTAGGPLLMRLYFIHGGKRVWLSSSLETAGWPMMFPLLAASYYQRRKSNKQAKLIYITPNLFGASIVIGVLTGLDDYLYAYGVANLPVSTSALIIATQLAFTALFAFLLVRQKFTSYSINAIFMLTIGAVILGLHTSSDRPEGESDKKYIMGFLMTLAAAALYGLVLPLVELTYKKAQQTITYTLVMEMQLVISFFATAVGIIGMIVNKDFQAIAREGREYELGEATYYVVLVINAIVWQLFFLGAIGVIFCGSSLLSGIIISVVLPITEVLAVIFYHESFKAEKGISLTLSLWGFLSYFYGEYKNTRQKTPTSEIEIPLTVQSQPSSVNNHVSETH